MLVARLHWLQDADAVPLFEKHKYRHQPQRHDDGQDDELFRLHPVTYVGHMVAFICNEKQTKEPSASNVTNSLKVDKKVKQNSIS